MRSYKFTVSRDAAVVQENFAVLLLLTLLGSMLRCGSRWKVEDMDFEQWLESLSLGWLIVAGRKEIQHA